MKHALKLQAAMKINNMHNIKSLSKNGLYTLVGRTLMLMSEGYMKLRKMIWSGYVARVSIIWVEYAKEQNGIIMEQMTCLL